MELLGRLFVMVACVANCAFGVQNWGVRTSETLASLDVGPDASDDEYMRAWMSRLQAESLQRLQGWTPDSPEGAASNTDCEAARIKRSAVVRDMKLHDKPSGVAVLRVDLNPHVYGRQVAEMRGLDDDDDDTAYILPITRRFAVALDATLHELHEYALVPMLGLSRCLHTYKFTRPGDGALFSSRSHLPFEEARWFQSNGYEFVEARDVTVGYLLDAPGAAVEYLYDLGDLWNFTVTVEEVLEEPPEDAEVRWCDDTDLSDELECDDEEEVCEMNFENWEEGDWCARQHRFLALETSGPTPPEDFGGLLKAAEHWRALRKAAKQLAAHRERANDALAVPAACPSLYALAAVDALNRADNIDLGTIDVLVGFALSSCVGTPGAYRSDKRELYIWTAVESLAGLHSPLDVYDLQLQIDKEVAGYHLPCGNDKR